MTTHNDTTTTGDREQDDLIVAAARAAAAVLTGTNDQASKLALLETMAEREDARIRGRAVELAVAPNCQPDILSNPPRVVTIEGARYLQIKGNDGWVMDADMDGSEHGYPVLEVSRLEAHGGLVLIATPGQVVLMTAQDFDHPIE